MIKGIDRLLLHSESQSALENIKHNYLNLPTDEMHFRYHYQYHS